MGDLSHHEGQVQNLDGQLGHSDRAVIVIGDIQDTLGRKTGKGRGESNHLWQEDGVSKTPSLIEPHPQVRASELLGHQCQEPLEGAFNDTGSLLTKTVKVKVLVAQSCPTLCDPWTAACQAPPSMEFYRQEYWDIKLSQKAVSPCKSLSVLLPTQKVSGVPLPNTALASILTSHSSNPTQSVRGFSPGF